MIIGCRVVLKALLKLRLILWKLNISLRINVLILQREDCQQGLSPENEHITSNGLNKILFSLFLKLEKGHHIENRVSL